MGVRGTDFGYLTDQDSTSSISRQPGFGCLHHRYPLDLDQPANRNFPTCRYLEIPASWKRGVSGAERKAAPCVAHEARAGICCAAYILIDALPARTVGGIG